MVWIYFSVPTSFYRQGLTLVSRCFQLTGAWFPAAETPHTGVRPWKQGHRLTEKEMRSIDLPGHLCDLTRARAVHRIDAVPASYPREVLRGERPKRVLVSFARSKETPSGKRPHQAGKPDTWMVRRSIPPPQLTLCHLPLHKGGFVSGRGKHKSPGGSSCFLRGFVMLWVSET